MIEYKKPEKKQRGSYDARCTGNADLATIRHPWERYPSCEVFRHAENRKWFAVIMTIPKKTPGIVEDGEIDVVNLKCAPEIIDAMWQEPGIHPAYHMSRGHWLSVTLDGTVADDTVPRLLGISHKLTAPKKRIKKHQRGT